jgi:hypothetical protein
VAVTDPFGNTGSNTTIHAVIFNFTGFFQPVDNPPVFNQVKAGSSIPIKFSLSGDQGLEIFAAGYPASTRVICDSSDGIDPIEETVTGGSSGLTYDPFTGLYTYVWKTSKSWRGTCREFVIQLTDGTLHYAYFTFRQ